jgi:glyoxylase-like metal-dependent hydrolase (beta-lactamase superfamily II)
VSVPFVQGFFEPASSTVTYVVDGGEGTPCAVIDPVLDFDLRSARTGTSALDPVCGFIRQRRLRLDWILETHVHADHLSAAPELKRRLGGRIAIGAGVREVQKNFRTLYHLEDGFPCDGSQFDHLFEDGERFAIGALEGEALATPGHTPSCVTYRIGDALFVGDTMFMPDGGTARCDFPGGDARLLYRSLRRVLALPEETRVFVCHDYSPGGRPLAFETTVGAERQGNIHVRDGVDEDAFVGLREERDRGLALPALLLAAVQVNIRAGHLPPAESDGFCYLKLPINRF